MAAPKPELLSSRAKVLSNEKRRQVIALKALCYLLIIIVSYVWMTTPDLFAVRGVKPLFLLPFLVAVSARENEINSGILAIVAGFFWSFSSPLFWGFESMLLFLLITASCVIIRIYLLPKLPAVLFMSGLCTLLFIGVEFLLRYVIWGHSGVGELFMRVYVPTFFYTIALTPLYYGLVHFLHARFQAFLQ